MTGLTAWYPLHTTTGGTVSNDWFDGFEDNDLSEWEVNSMSTTSSPTYSGSYAGEISSTLNDWHGRRITSSGGEQIDRFEYWWREPSSGANGGGFRFRNSNGNYECGVTSDNPQWYVYHANGNTEVSSGGDYNSYTRFTVTFNWSNNTFDVDFEQPSSATTYTGTFDMRHGTDVEYVELWNHTTHNSATGTNQWGDASSVTLFVDDLDLRSSKTVNQTPDLSGYDRHGTPDGGVTTDVAGKGGLTAFSFDGTDDFVGTDLSYSSTRQHSLSFAFWAQNDSTSGDSGGRYLSTDLSENFGAWRSSGADTITLRVRAGGSYYDSTEIALADGEWNHFVAVFDVENGEYRVYQNGSEIDNISHSETGWGDGNYKRYLNIGVGSESSNPNTPQSGTYFAGEMADVRVYHRALSAEEARTLYSQGGGDYANPRADGLHYWTWDSTTADAWGSNDATNNGGTYVSGVRGDAIYFNGSDAYAEAGPVNPTEITVAGWVKAPTGDLHVVAQNRYNGSWGQGYNLRVNHNEAAYFNVEDTSGTTQSISTPESPIPNSWFHVAATYDGSTARIYLNGVERDSASVADLGDSSKNLWFGRDGQYREGTTDDVRVYDFALEPHEVFELYQYGTFGRDMRALLVRR